MNILSKLKKEKITKPQPELLLNAEDLRLLNLTVDISAFKDCDHFKLVKLCVASEFKVIYSAAVKYLPTYSPDIPSFVDYATRLRLSGLSTEDAIRKCELEFALGKR